MSELKVYRDPKDGLAYREFYEKSEADKVIEEKDEIIDELKEHIDELQKATDSAWSKVNAIYDELRHSNRKRCLAMAWWCEATALWCYQAANTLPAGFHATLYGKPVMIEPDLLFKRHALLTKWSAKWRELAEKFKEASNV